MLQVARLAPKQLGDSRDLVTAFLHGQRNPDGGFRDRSGNSDLYYTVFGLEALSAVQADPGIETVAYASRFGDGDGLDFVHLACLARVWAAVSRDLPAPRRAILERIESHRSTNGGYSQTRGVAEGNLYAAFLALGAYQDLRAEMPDRSRLVDSVARCRARDGGYANRPDMAEGLTPLTAAAIALLRQLEGAVPPDVADWLLARCRPEGGFLASAGAPIPDLLSTATGLHALTSLHVEFGSIREACLDFVDTLWTSRGGFYGSWADDTLDCEYTYYGLLALGHLSL